MRRIQPPLFRLGPSDFGLSVELVVGHRVMVRSRLNVHWLLDRRRRRRELNP